MSFSAKAAAEGKEVRISVDTKMPSPPDLDRE
jgi:hypothetical protein